MIFSLCATENRLRVRNLNLLTLASNKCSCGFAYLLFVIVGIFSIGFFYDRITNIYDFRFRLRDGKQARQIFSLCLFQSILPPHAPCPQQKVGLRTLHPHSVEFTTRVWGEISDRQAICSLHCLHQELLGKHN